MSQPILGAMLKLVARPFFPQPPQAPYLWHLIRMNQLFKLRTFLQHGIWLARLDQFRDELEGTLPHQNLGSSANDDVTRDGG